MKKILSLIIALAVVICALPFGAITVSAETSGYYTYSVSNGKATITNCSTSISGEVTIPSTLGGYPVTIIYYAAFSNCSSITSITIPESVTSIGMYAFEYCSSLTSITIGDGVTSIGNHAFSGCSLLTSITIGDSVTSIGSYAFSHCSSLTKVTIPDGVTSIGSYAFNGCNSLIQVIIPDSVTSIGECAFYNCSSLTKVTIPDSVTSIGECAFYNCSSLTKVTIPDGVTSIDKYTFYQCSSLTSITIPESVTSIGEDAFYYCRSLTKVNITDLAAWCEIDFYDDDSNPLSYANNLYINETHVANITIPDSVKEIKKYTFYNCSSITSITIPDSVTSIGYQAFNDCSSLTEVTIPDSVTSIGNYAFRYCSSLTKVNITDLAAWCKLDFSDDYSNPLEYGSGGNIYLNNELLTNIELPKDMNIIGINQFYKCKSIENVFIPKDVVLIKQDAFYNCSNIKNVYYEGSAEEWAEVSILGGNTPLSNATVYFNCAGIPGKAQSVKITKLPTKTTYIEMEESLDLSGGILTIYYEGGATKDIDLSTLNATGFDNSVLGEQTLSVKYGDFTAQFNVNVVMKPIAFIAISKTPDKVDYKIGDSLELKGAKLAVVYPEGGFKEFDITADMVSGFDSEKAGVQFITVNYRGYEAFFKITVFDYDLNDDGTVNAQDLAQLKTVLLQNSNDKKFDLNGDENIDILDLIRLKKILAE